MDTKLKKSKGSFLKALCVFIIIASMMAGSYISFIMVEDLWRAGATYEAFRDALNYGTVAKMEQSAFNAQLENFHINSLFLRKILYIMLKTLLRYYIINLNICTIM